MALYKGTALVSQVVGKVGTLNFMRWKNKNVVRQHPPIVTDPNSVRQVAMRAAVSTCGARWKTVLTPDQRQKWEIYAKTYKMRMDTPSGIRQIPQGNKGVFTGINAYVLVSVKLVSAGMIILNDPPLPRPRAESITNLSAFWTPVLGPLNVSWIPPVGAAAADMVRVWVDSIQQLYHRQIAASFPATASPGLIASVNSVGGLPIVLTSFVPSDIIVQADIIYSDGRLGHSTETVEVQLI